MAFGSKPNPNWVFRKHPSVANWKIRQLLCVNNITPRPQDLYDLYNLFPHYDLDISGQIDSPCVCLVHVAWEPYNLHDLGQASGFDLYHKDHAQHLTTAG